MINFVAFVQFVDQQLINFVESIQVLDQLRIESETQTHIKEQTNINPTVENEHDNKEIIQNQNTALLRSLIFLIMALFFSFSVLKI